jgi:hypothetical protein
VRFKNVTIVGDTNGVYEAGYDIGIFFDPGTSNQTVEDCNISVLQMGIYATKVNGLTVRNSYIHDVYRGISGGYNYTAGRDTIPTAFLIEGNRIICTFGGQTYSRPIEFLFGTHYRILNNELRGGGMSFEALNQGTADTNRTARIVSGNDCDTPISTGNASIISGNVLDLFSAPVGRGMLPGYTQAIEGGAYTLVSNNVVRHFPTAVAGASSGSQIVGNYFESCGDTSLINAFGVITLYSTMTIEAGTGTGTTISNNTFRNSILADIRLSTNSADTLRGITISNNYSYNCHRQFLLATSIKSLTVTGNYIQDACSADSSSGLNTTTAWGVWETDNTSSYYDANTFINTLTNGYGMYEAINPTSGAVIGFTRTRGIRNVATPILLANSPHVIGKTEVNGTLVDLQAEEANALVVKGSITLNRDTTTNLNPVLYLNGVDSTGAGTIVWHRQNVRGGVNDWALLTDPAANAIHFWDYHGTPGRRLTIENVTGNATFTGNVKAATVHADSVWARAYGNLPGPYHLFAAKDSMVYTPNVTQNVYFKMAPGLTSIEADGVTFAGDSITVVHAGDYMMEVSLTMTGAGGDDFSIGVFKNSVRQYHMINTTTDAANYQAVTLSFYLRSLVAGDFISLRTTNLRDGDDPTFRGMSVFFEREH